MSGEANISDAEWAIVELMGHRRRAGRVEEVERFGAKLLRVDIPTADGSFVTEFYGGSAIYALRPCAETLARAAAERIGDPRPVVPATYRIGNDVDDSDLNEPDTSA